MLQSCLDVILVANVAISDEEIWWDSQDEALDQEWVHLDAASFCQGTWQGNEVVENSAYGMI